MKSSKAYGKISIYHKSRKLVTNIHKKSMEGRCNCREITLLSNAPKLYATILQNKFNKHSKIFLE
jgi:hypothetical protein